MQAIFAFFHELEVWLSAAFYYPAGYELESFCNKTGLVWGITERQNFWYRQPGFHIFEALFYLPVTILLYVYAFKPAYRQLVTSMPRVGKPAYFLDKLFGWVLLYCWVMQLVFKVLRPQAMVQILWLFMPCHLITISWALLLLAPPSMHNMPLLRFVASMCSLTSWGAIMAGAFPDWSDHQFYPLEGIVFFVHHFILLLAPHYFAAVHGLPRMSARLLFAYIFLNCFIQFYIQTPLSYISGVNLNYHLHPHLGMVKKAPNVFDSKWYRFQVPVALSLFALAYWYLIEIVNKVYFAVVGGSAPLSPVSSRASSPSPTPSQVADSRSLTRSNRGGGARADAAAAAGARPSGGGRGFAIASASTPLFSEKPPTKSTRTSSSGSKKKK